MVCNLKTTTQENLATIIAIFFADYSAADGIDYENLILTRDEIIKDDGSDSNSFNDDEFIENIKSYTRANNIAFNETAYKNLLTKAGNITPALVIDRLVIKDESDISRLFKYSKASIDYFNSKLKFEMFNNLFIDFDNKKYIESDEEANKKINGLKNNLFDILRKIYNKDANNESITDTLYNSEGLVINYENYKKVVSYISGIYSDAYIKKIQFGKPINATVSTQHLDLIDTFSALLLLNNFDKMMELKFSKYLKPKYLFKGSLENPTNGVKYERNFQALGAPASFKDDHAASDVSHTSSDLIKLITDIIPFYNTDNVLVSGSYLGITNLRYLAGELKKDEKTNGSFSSNPIEQLNKYFKNPANKNKSSVYNSIKHFLTSLDELQPPTNANNFFDIKALLAFEINKVASTPYVTYNKDEDSFVDLIEMTKVSQALGYFTLIVANTALNNNFETIEIGVNSAETMINIKKATGLDITDAILTLIDKKSSETYETILAKLVPILNNIIKSAGAAANKMTDAPDKINEAIKSVDSLLRETGEVMNVLEAITNYRIQTPISNFKNKEKNTIPVYRQTSLSTNDVNSVEKFKKLHLGKGANLFADCDILNGTVLRLEGTTKEKSKDSGKFSAEEGFYASFVGDFLETSLKSGRSTAKKTQVLIHPFPYSDKKTDYLKAISLSTLLYSDNFSSSFQKAFITRFGGTDMQINGKNSFTLADMSTEQLAFLDYFYNKEYYSVLENKVIGDLQKLFNLASKEQIQSKLNSFKNYEEFFKFIQAHPELEITEGLHYKIYKGKFALDRVLFENIAFYQNTFDNFLSVRAEDKKQFLDEINKFPILQLQTIKHKIHKFHLNSRFKLLPLEEKKKFIPNSLSTDGVLDPYLDRYFVLTNLIKSQYENITTKGNYLYVTKNALTDSIEKEQSDAFLAGSKRMVTHTASIQPYNTNTTNGVNQIIKSATIEDFTVPVANYSGDAKNQDSMDGSAYYEAFTARLTENSLPGLGVKGTQKPFGTHLGFGYASAYKFAAFPITNELIRNSRGFGNSKINFENIQKRLSDTKIEFNYLFQASDFLYKNFNGEKIEFSNLMDAINKHGLFYIKNGKYYKLENLYIEENGEIETHSILVDKFANPIKQIIIYEGDPIAEEIVQIFKYPVESVWDLYQIFGGADSYTFENGELTKGELSIDIVVSYINNVGYKIGDKVVQPLKDSLIGMLASQTAVKMGATNLNPKSSWTSNEPFATSKIDLTNFGMQQDYGHESDESEVSEMSQVIAMLSALGNTTGQAEEVYQALQYIMKLSMEDTEKALEPIRLLSENATLEEETKAKSKLYKKLAKFVKDEFSKADTISSAQAILDIITKTKDMGGIPFSDPKIFGLFSVNFLSNLNKDVLKRKFPGLGGILNPGNMQLYELPDGTKASWSDLLETAVSKYPKENLSNEDLVNKFLNEIFYSGINSFYEQIGVSIRKEENIPWKDDPTKFNNAEYFSIIGADPSQEFQLKKDQEDGFYSVHFKTTKGELTEEQKVKLIDAISSKLKIGDKISTWGAVTAGGFSGLARFLTAGFKEIGNRDIFDKQGKLINTIPIYEKVELTELDNLLKLYKTSIPAVVTDISLMDTVLIDNVEVYVETPQILQKIYAANKPIRKIFGKSRDLKPDNITWKTKINEVIQYHNFWTLDSVLISTNFDANDKKLNDFLLYMTGSADLVNSLLSTDKEISTAAKIEVMNLLTKWTNRFALAISHGKTYPALTLDENGNYDFNTLFDGDKLTNKLASNYFDGVRFLPIFDYKRQNYEAIVPKLNKSTQNLGSASMYAIKQAGKNFFKNSVLSTYKFNGNLQDIDMFARTKIGNLGIKLVDKATLEALKNQKIEILTEVDEETDLTYRVTEDGERLYQIPAGSFIIRNGAEDVLVFKLAYKQQEIKTTNTETGEVTKSKIKVLNKEILTNFLKSVRPHSLQIFNPDFLNLNIKFNKLSPYRALHKNLSTKEELIQAFEDGEYSTVELVSSMIYTSFLKSNSIISSRIPAQALQSVMSMDVVGFTGQDTNDVFVSVWQIFLQGSDFDIDKAYMIFYGLDKFGIYEGWSPLFNYLDISQLNLSERLPFPTGQEVEVQKVDVATQGFINLDDYEERILTVKDYITLLKNVDKLQYVKADDKFIKDITKKLNSHTKFKPTEAAVKNFVTYKMHEVIDHPANQMSATTSVDTGGLGWKMEVNKKDTGVLWNVNNPLHLYQLKEINAVGKATVGVMANGVKAFFGLTHVFNKAYQGEIDVTDNSYFYQNILGKHTVRLADTVTSEEQVNILNESVRKITGIQEDIAFLVNGDVSISLSALVTLATD